MDPKPKLNLNTPETPKEFPDQERFFQNVELRDAPPGENKEARIEVTILYASYLVELYINYYGLKGDGKTYKIKSGGHIPFIFIPLNDVISENWQSPYGELDKVEKVKIKSGKDLFSPYASALDFKKLNTEIMRFLKENKEKLFDVIEMPPGVSELREVLKAFGDVVVNLDASSKTVTLSKKVIDSFPNPYYPERCIRDIETRDGWKVVYSD